MIRFVFSLFLLATSLPMIAQKLSYPLENLVGKDTASAEYKEIAALTEMQEIKEWMQNYDIKEEHHFAFKAMKFHAIIKLERHKPDPKERKPKKNERKNDKMTVTQITIYNPNKNTRKIKGKTIEAEIPYGFNWEMSYSDLTKKFGHANLNEVNWINHTIQFQTSAKNKDKLHTMIVFPYKSNYAIYTPPPSNIDDTPPLMKSILYDLEKKHAFLDRKEKINLPLTAGSNASSVDVKFTIPASVKSYALFITMEHGEGFDGIFIKDNASNNFNCPINLVPGNRDFWLYGTDCSLSNYCGGKTYTLHLDARGVYAGTKVTVYYLIEKKDAAAAPIYFCDRIEQILTAMKGNFSTLKGEKVENKSNIWKSLKTYGITDDYIATDYDMNGNVLLHKYFVTIGEVDNEAELDKKVKDIINEMKNCVCAFAGYRLIAVDKKTDENMVYYWINDVDKSRVEMITTYAETFKKYRIGLRIKTPQR